jgi:REP element-mobilizing transposase RayT
VNFNFLFNTKSWQSVLAADVDAGVKRATKSAEGERRISLIDCEATLDHMLLSIGARKSDHASRRKHLITGASARFTLRAAPDIRFNAGVSNFWQKRTSAPGLNLTRPSAASAARGPSETL